MTTNLFRERNVGGGRPRAFENERIFQATARALFRNSYSGLTLDAVAREAGCSAPALSRRFGSKKALLKAYMEWTYKNMRERFVAVHTARDQPLAALRERIGLPIEDRLEEFGAFTGWYEMSQDPELKEPVNAVKRLWEHEMSTALTEARQAGELAECDPQAVGRIIAAALAGITFLWTSDDVMPLPERLVETFDEIISRYRP